MGPNSLIQAGSNALPAGAPLQPGTAVNGVSLDSSGRVVLGNDVGDLSAPAQLLSDREIVMGANRIIFFQPSFPARVLTIKSECQLEFEITGATSPGTVQHHRIINSISNITGGDSMQTIEMGLDSTSNLFVAWFNSSTGSFPNGNRTGSGVSGRGAVLGQFTVHGTQYVSVRAGGTDSGFSSTEVARFANNLLTIFQAVRINIAAARSGASVVLVRNTGNSEVQSIAGASGTFTTADGKTVTVLDGVITSIV